MVKRAFSKALSLFCAMQKGSTGRLVIAALYFLLTAVLFFLPGSALPKATWLDEIYFDKWVHIGIFTVLLFLWCKALIINSRRTYIILILIAVLYGFLIEVIQDRFVINRSYDMGDVAADFVGSIVGAVVWYRYKKNKPL